MRRETSEARVRRLWPVENGVLVGNLACQRCGYNLRTRRADEPCPECRAPMALARADSVSHGRWSAVWFPLSRRAGTVGVLLARSLAVGVLIPTLPPRPGGRGSLGPLPCGRGSDLRPCTQELPHHPTSQLASRSLPHPTTHSPPHPTTQADWLSPSPPHLLTCSPPHLLTCSPAHPFTSPRAHLPTCSPAHLPTSPP